MTDYQGLSPRLLAAKITSDSISTSSSCDILTKKVSFEEENVQWIHPRFPFVHLSQTDLDRLQWIELRLSDTDPKIIHLGLSDAITMCNERFPPEIFLQRPNIIFQSFHHLRDHFQESLDFFTLVTKTLSKRCDLLQSDISSKEERGLNLADFCLAILSNCSPMLNPSSLHPVKFAGLCRLIKCVLHLSKKCLSFTPDVYVDILNAFQALIKECRYQYKESPSSWSRIVTLLSYDLFLSLADVAFRPESSNPSHQCIENIADGVITDPTIFMTHSWLFEKGLPWASKKVKESYVGFWELLETLMEAGKCLRESSLGSSDDIANCVRLLPIHANPRAIDILMEMLSHSEDEAAKVHCLRTFLQTQGNERFLPNVLMILHELTKSVLGIGGHLMTNVNIGSISFFTHDSVNLSLLAKSGLFLSIEHPVREYWEELFVYIFKSEDVISKSDWEAIKNSLQYCLPILECCLGDGGLLGQFLRREMSLDRPSKIFDRVERIRSNMRMLFSVKKSARLFAEVNLKLVLSESKMDYDCFLNEDMTDLPKSFQDKDYIGLETTRRKFASKRNLGHLVELCLTSEDSRYFALDELSSHINETETEITPEELTHILNVILETSDSIALAKFAKIFLKLVMHSRKMIQDWSSKEECIILLLSAIFTAKKNFRFEIMLCLFLVAFEQVVEFSADGFGIENVPIDCILCPNQCREAKYDQQSDAFIQLAQSTWAKQVKTFWIHITKNDQHQALQEDETKIYEDSEPSVNMATLLSSLSKSGSHEECRDILGRLEALLLISPSQEMLISKGQLRSGFERFLSRPPVTNEDRQLLFHVYKVLVELCHKMDEEGFPWIQHFMKEHDIINWLVEQCLSSRELTILSEFLPMFPKSLFSLEAAMKSSQFSQLAPLVNNLTDVSESLLEVAMDQLASDFMSAPTPNLLFTLWRYLTFSQGRHVEKSWITHEFMLCILGLWNDEQEISTRLLALEVFESMLDLDGHEIVEYYICDAFHESLEIATNLKEHASICGSAFSLLTEMLSTKMEWFEMVEPASNTAIRGKDAMFIYLNSIDLVRKCQKLLESRVSITSRDNGLLIVRLTEFLVVVQEGLTSSLMPIIQLLCEIDTNHPILNEMTMHLAMQENAFHEKEIDSICKVLTPTTKNSSLALILTSHLILNELQSKKTNKKLFSATQMLTDQHSENISLVLRSLSVVKKRQGNECSFKMTSTTLASIISRMNVVKEKDLECLQSLLTLGFSCSKKEFQSQICDDMKNMMKSQVKMSSRENMAIWKTLFSALNNFCMGNARIKQILSCNGLVEEIYDIVAMFPKEEIPSQVIHFLITCSTNCPEFANAIVYNSSKSLLSLLFTRCQEEKYPIIRLLMVLATTPQGRSAICQKSIFETLLVKIRRSPPFINSYLELLCSLTAFRTTPWHREQEVIAEVIIKGAKSAKETTRHLAMICIRNLAFQKHRSIQLVENVTYTEILLQQLNGHFSTLALQSILALVTFCRKASVIFGQALLQYQQNNMTNWSTYS